MKKIKSRSLKIGISNLVIFIFTALLFKSLSYLPLELILPLEFVLLLLVVYIYLVSMIIAFIGMFIGVVDIIKELKIKHSLGIIVNIGYFAIFEKFLLMLGLNTIEAM